ncbi:unnamed protein product, partial [Mesorhabditis belari]|uniref:Uncharacterized protein n=1 Tax=Mesorhabditis belari TaxID=2138241 RepID=A0AAF3EL78_9BILA
MARNDQIVSPIYRPDIVKIFKMVECISFFFLAFYVMLYVKLLLRRKFFHVNLVILLCAQPISHLLSLSMRIFKHAMVEWVLISDIGIITTTQGATILFWDNLFSDIFVSTSFQIVVGISVERIIAMTYINEYEAKYKNPRLAIVIILVCFTWSSILLYLWNLDVIPNNVAYPLQYTFFGSAAVGFVILRIASWYAYKRVANERYASIEDRYLTAQNLKAAILLCWLAPYKSLCNVMSLFVYNWTFEQHTPDFFPYYGNFYFLGNHVQLYVQLILTILGHRQLIDEFLKMIGLRWNQNEQDVRSVIGGRMIFSYEEENRIYQKQMQDMWQSGAKEEKGNKKEKRKKYTSVEPQEI